MANNVLSYNDIKPFEFYSSLLTVTDIPITNNFSVHIPTVGQVLSNEQEYLALASTLVASPMSYMIQLDEMGYKLWDKMTDYELFTILFKKYVIQLNLLEKNAEIQIPPDIRDSLMRSRDIFSLIFGETDIVHFSFIEENTADDTESDPSILMPKKGFFYNSVTKAIINENIYNKMADTIRKINLFEHKKGRPANENSKRYLFDKEVRRQKRLKNKKPQPYFEPLVVALVNNVGFKYDYEGVENLSLYKFNQSYRQIAHDIQFQNINRGIYAGTIDSSKLTDKSILSWVLTK